MTLDDLFSLAARPASSRASPLSRCSWRFCTVRGGSVRPPNVLQKLRKRPEIVRTLSEYYTHTMTIPEMGISVRALPEDVLATSQRVREEHGLLVGDSLLVAAAGEHGAFRGLTTCPC